MRIGRVFSFSHSNMLKHEAVSELGTHTLVKANFLSTAQYAWSSFVFYLAIFFPTYNIISILLYDSFAIQLGLFICLYYILGSSNFLVNFKKFICGTSPFWGSVVQLTGLESTTIVLK
jgi:hypothetical protein